MKKFLLILLGCSLLLSACNQPLSVAPTIRCICSMAVANFMRMVKGEEWKHIIFSNPFMSYSKAF